MSPLELIVDICSICSRISTFVDTVQANKEQCGRLAHRIKIIADSLHRLKRVKDTEAFRKALNDLRSHILACEKLIAEFTSKTGLARVFKSGKYKKEFERLNRYLEQDLEHLDMGINVQQLMNRDDDEADRKKDAEALLEKQDEMLTLLGEESDQLHEIKGAQADLFAFLREEFRYLLRIGVPGKAAPSLISIEAEEVECGEKIADGTSIIYRGFFRGQDVAIKKFDRVLDDVTHEQFQREVQILEGLRSDHVVLFYGACIKPGKECLVMKYMAHGSLREVLEKKQSFTPEQQKCIALEIAKGLHYLHSQGMIHRDLTDQHVLFDEDWHAKLSGFGLSKVKSGIIQTAKKTHELPFWVAPELFGKGICYTEKADVYAYGVILWELLTGQRPYENSHLDLEELIEKIREGYRANILETVPKFYEDIILQCWEKDPLKRPGLDVVIRDLEVYVPRPKSPTAEELYKLGMEDEKAQKFSEAMDYYRRSADKGFVHAKTNLGDFFWRGRGGSVPIDKVKAFTLLFEAAQAGHARAQFNFGQMLEYGDGVTQDYEQALAWYQKAAAQNIEQAKIRIPRVMEKIAALENARAGVLPTINQAETTEGSQHCFSKPAGV